MKMTMWSMSVNLEQTDGAGELPPLLHPGRSTAATSAAAVAAPILNNSRRVTFLEGMGTLSPSFHCVRSEKPTRHPTVGPVMNPRHCRTPHPAEFLRDVR